MGGNYLRAGVKDRVRRDSRRDLRGVLEYISVRKVLFFFSSKVLV